MEQHHMQPVIIEDLVDYGFEQGIDQGRLGMARESLLDVLEARGWSVTDVQRAHILAETDLERLRLWHRNAVTAGDVAQVFAER
jgi:hypothetical protein